MHADRSPIGVAIVGTGFFGGGLLRRLALLPEFTPHLAANRTIERALAAYKRAGVSADQITVTSDADEAQTAIDAGRCVVTSDHLLATRLRGIDVVADATGDLLVGAETALTALQAGKHVVAANTDVQATVGFALNAIAQQSRVVYTDIEGDEPGLLTQLVEYCGEMGLEVLLAGVGKGVLKRYATPDTQREFALANRLQPWLATAAADGTKLNFELTVVANATGLVPAVQGMFGPATELSEIVPTARDLGLLDGGHYVDYQLGGRGVFVVVRSEDPEVRADFQYLKLGDGPYYLLHRPGVLAHYAAVRSIRRAARFGVPTVAPATGPVAETVAVAKRDLVAGQHLDGIGGFDAYGLIARAAQARTERLVPIGLAQYARLRRSVPRDQAITLDDVDFEQDNVALRLRREQDAAFR
jgi:predicted homoserine dehydrogenase-like protein